MHEVNTERLLTWSTGMTHREGGWPKEIDPREKQETARYRKKLERDEDFRTTVTALAPVVMRVMKQNNTVDLYENYFENDLDNHTAEATAIKSLAVFRDPSSVTRTAASVSENLAVFGAAPLPSLGRGCAPP
jgi:dynein intermediate chain 2, axonemal